MTKVNLKKLTTIGVGGPVNNFIKAISEKELINTLIFLNQKRKKHYVIGEGSNIVGADKGFSGTIVKVATNKIEIKGSTVQVSAGANLLRLIKKMNSNGLGGMEKMAGIPGTVAGAIYGNAGAYGQEIKDSLVEVRFFNGKKVKVLSKKEVKFSYRTSVFKKHKDWVILSADFKFTKSSPKELKKISDDIIKTRNKKYRPGLKCPGSFFKNIVLADKTKKEKDMLQKKVPKAKIMYGKIPSGYLLEEVGAKGMSSGGIKIAKHHANLFYNAGGGKAADVKHLSRVLKQKVRRKFGITLEEEVQYL